MQGTQECVDFSLEIISLPECNYFFCSSGSSFQRWEGVGRTVLLWSAVFEDGIATAAVWRDAGAMEAIRTTASSVNMFKNRVDTYLRRAGYM